MLVLPAAERYPYIASRSVIGGRADVCVAIVWRRRRASRWRRGAAGRGGWGGGGRGPMGAATGQARRRRWHTLVAEARVQLTKNEAFQKAPVAAPRRRRWRSRQRVPASLHFISHIGTVRKLCKGGLQIIFIRERACSAHRRREAGEQDEKTEHWHMRLRSWRGTQRVSLGTCTRARHDLVGSAVHAECGASGHVCMGVDGGGKGARTVRTGDASESESIEKMVSSL